MECNIYSLYDMKLERYMTPPLFVRDDKEAVAIVLRSVPKEILYDVHLEFIGVFDDKNSVIEMKKRRIIPCVSEVKENGSN